MFEDFKKASKQDWASGATSDLKGENVNEKYNWQFGSITVEPYYDTSDTENIDYLSFFRNRLAKDDDPSGEVRIWNNLQPIEVKEEKAANAEALFALINGADGIEFICNTPQLDVEILLNDILPEYCFLSFRVNSKNSFELLFNHFKKQDKKNVVIEINSSEEIDLSPYFQFNTKDIRIVSISSGNSDSVENEISQILLNCNAEIRRLILRGIQLDDIVKSLIIKTTIGTDFFGEIAKVRAIRNLVYQIIKAYGADASNPEDVIISCQSPVWTEERYNPHANMLKGSTAALAAILGGCDILIIEPEKQEPLSKRIAKNVSTILKEESYLSKVADPVAGSYYLEKLTDELAKKSWAIFQNEFENQKTASTV